jgi:hypothetical protein
VDIAPEQNSVRRLVRPAVGERAATRRRRPSIGRPSSAISWLPFEEPPAPLSPRVACVDYSVARGGPLTAYRFDGESELMAEKFVTV